MSGQPIYYGPPWAEQTNQVLFTGQPVFGQTQASMPVGQNLPSKKPASPLALVVVAFMDVCLVIAINLVMCLGSFHFTTLAFVHGAHVSFNIGLLRVTTTGNPSGIISGGIVKRTIRTIMTALNGRSLAEFEALACGAEFVTLIPAGCDSVVLLRACSYIFVAAIALSSLFWIVGAAVTAVFWKRRRDCMTRRVMFFFHIVPGFLLIIGALFYVLIGGTDVQFGMTIPYLMSDVSPVDLAGGFYMSCLLGLLGVMLPALMYFMIPRDVCHDYWKRMEFDEF